MIKTLVKAHMASKIVFLITISYIFSLLIRLIWVYNFWDVDSFKFLNEFMINTNDGYYFAEGARDIISGISQPNDLSPISSATSQLTAFLAKILPFSFETVIFYMPAFLSSLVVLPIILIAHSFNKLSVGVIAALLASIAWSYYNRTMVGYYDTDMLNIVFPTFLLWSLVLAFRTKEEKYLIFTALDIIAYRWWYPQSYALESAFVFLILLYIFYLYIKKENNIYFLKLVSIMFISMLMIDATTRVVGVILLYILFRDKKYDKYIYYITAFTILLYFVTGGFDLIWAKLKGYVFKSEIISSSSELNLHFFTVLQTIREAGSIPFETFANRISGNIVVFILSFIGYIYMIFRYRVLLLSLPLFSLGFLAYGIPGLVPPAGLRFTIYAVPIFALGFAFILVDSLGFIKKKISLNNYIYFTILSLFTILALYPNIKHANDYRVPTVFNKNEVEVLDKLKNIANREDYVLSWWDYGYPIRYYSDVKTLIDGGKHSGSQNFPVSFSLTSLQTVSAKMARLDVEYTEKNFLDRKSGSNIEQMTKDYGFKNTNDFLSSLYTDINLPSKTRDIYFYLPYRMMNIYPTVTLFSNIDLMNGQKRQRPFFYKSRFIKEDSLNIYIGNNISIEKKGAKLNIRGQKIPLKRFVKTAYVGNDLKVQKQYIDKNSRFSVIYMSNYKSILIIDENVYNSLYFKLFVLEEYDKNLFEKIILTPNSKVYKLKI